MSRFMSVTLLCALAGVLCSLTHAHADSAVLARATAMHLAALQELDPDTGTTSVPCGADGICNIGACSNDPDCPALPNDLPESSTPPQSSTEVFDCAPGETLEMRETVAFGAMNWNAFETAIESFDGWPVNIKNCLENRFKSNGKIVCEKDMRGQCKGNNAWASMLNKRCHLCPVFVNTVKGLTGPANKDNRKACYFAILAHEWSHTCERTHKTVEIIDNVAFDFYKSKHPAVTIGIDSCGMD